MNSFEDSKWSSCEAFQLHFYNDEVTPFMKDFNWRLTHCNEESFGRFAKGFSLLMQLTFRILIIRTQYKIKITLFLSRAPLMTLMI